MTTTAMEAMAATMSMTIKMMATMTIKKAMVMTAMMMTTMTTTTMTMTTSTITATMMTKMTRRP